MLCPSGFCSLARQTRTKLEKSEMSAIGHSYHSREEDMLEKGVVSGEEITVGELVGYQGRKRYLHLQRKMKENQVT
jgi:hypothetical protein